MDTIFISHSSAQKDLVERVVDFIGRDSVIVDIYSFESATKILQQIESSLEVTKVFVIFLSQEALDSKWVIGELDRAYQLMGEGIITSFCPFIVDDNVSLEHQVLKRKKWVKESLLTYYRSPRLIAQVIKRRLQEAIWRSHPQVAIRDQLFIGRGADMDAVLEHLYSHGATSNRRAIIVSGLKRIGRKTLLREIIKTPILKGLQPAFEPITVSMQEEDSLEDFILQMNDILLEYEYDNLLNLMKDSSKWVNIAVKQLNRIAESRERIIIDDYKCIVLNNGRLTDWFLDIVKNHELSPQIHLFVCSVRKPLSSIEQTFKEIIMVQLDTLTKESMGALFLTYAESFGQIIAKTDVDYFVSKFTGFPEQAIISVDNIIKGNMFLAKKQINAIRNMFDDNFREIVAELEGLSPTYIPILILMSKIEVFSFELLQELSPIDISDAMDVFARYSLYEVFGPAREFCRLNPALQNYVDRNSLELPSEYAQYLKKHTKELLAQQDEHLTDLSAHLFNIRENLKNYGEKADEKYLLPSFVLKVVVEQYNAAQYDPVITLSKKILYETQNNRYRDIERSLHYWLCCALCHKKDPNFFEEVKYFNDSPYSQNFLMGFYYRYQKNYAKAKNYLEDALNGSIEAGDRDYRSKAEHELVIVLMHEDDYESALPLAKRSYEKDSQNSYHLEAYFRCLVQDSHPDREELKELIEQMKKSVAPRKDEMGETMEAEYAYYIDHDFSKAVSIFRNLIEKSTEKPKYAFPSLRRICDRQNAMPVYHSLRKSFEKKR